MTTFCGMTPILDENEAQCIDRHKQGEAVAHRVGVDLLSGYSLLLFLMYINKCLCKLGPLKRCLLGVNFQKLSPILLKALCFSILTTFLQYYEKVLSIIDISLCFEMKIFIGGAGDHFAAIYPLSPGPKQLFLNSTQSCFHLPNNLTNFTVKCIFAPLFCQKAHR